MVLFFHMQPHWDMVPTLSWTSAITRWGFSGVDIFFALSGFVVYRSARRSIPAQGIWPFARKRLLRIYMGYWPVLLLIALTTVFVHHAPLPDLKKMVFSTLLLYPNIWDNWLQPAWSLTMEIYFYLWIALIALLPQRHQIKAIACMMMLLAAWGFGWLIADRQGVFNGQQPLRFVFTGLGIEFLAGALLARAYDRQVRFFRTPRIALPLCLLLMAAGLGFGSLSPYFDRVEVMRAASFGVMGVSALVLALTLEHTRSTPPAWLVLVGDASYSLYLLHTFLLDASGRMRMDLGISSPPALLLYMAVLPVVIILLSVWWFRWVEKPIMKAAL
ncbi:MAG: acyltransferase [Gammaproteobacteria bacterium]|nr:acyltransferase [Gammaproteobacteria bacterium]MBU1505067.1 acyltransferase [Gammaproteobacteria bacterium]MBU2122266.1 acyltransferase [Gammaproteobacteria bacterium]MBU2169874.1 acyltransferase [Gammaproteobacteria bacterium]MBU2198633.1 acyltransferase [Gammaproteobacteria bacterium]